MLLVLGIGQCFEEFVKAVDATNIFRRTGPCPFEADRIVDARLLLRTALEENLMFPAVAEQSRTGLGPDPIIPGDPVPNRYGR